MVPLLLGSSNMIPSSSPLVLVKARLSLSPTILIPYLVLSQALSIIALSIPIVVVATLLSIVWLLSAQLASLSSPTLSPTPTALRASLPLPLLVCSTHAGQKVLTTPQPILMAALLLTLARAASICMLRVPIIPMLSSLFLRTISIRSNSVSGSVLLPQATRASAVWVL